MEEEEVSKAREVGEVRSYYIAHLVACDVAETLRTEIMTKARSRYQR